MKEVTDDIIYHIVLNSLGFDPTWYDCYRVYAKGSDGTEIPITLIHKKGLKLDGRYCSKYAYTCM